MFSLINRGRRLLSGAPLQLSPPGRGLGFLEGFSLRALSVSLRQEERGGREGVLLESPLRLTSPGREGRARGAFWWRLTPLVIVRLALLTALRFLWRLALPALLDFLYILGGGISRLTRELTSSHWCQPHSLHGGESLRVFFYF